MKKIIRLTENNLIRLIRKVITEETQNWKIVDPSNFEGGKVYSEQLIDEWNDNSTLLYNMLDELIKTKYQHVGKKHELSDKIISQIDKVISITQNKIYSQGEKLLNIIKSQKIASGQNNTTVKENYNRRFKQKFLTEQVDDSSMQEFRRLYERVLQGIYFDANGSLGEEIDTKSFIEFLKTILSFSELLTKIKNDVYAHREKAKKVLNLPDLPTSSIKNF